MNGYLMALAGACVGAAALVAAVTVALGVYDNSIKDQISDVQEQIESPTLQRDLEIVSQRESMLSGFISYNTNAGSTSQLFNYMPKAQSYVVNKLKEPLESVRVKDKVDLDICNVTIDDYSVTATFLGQSKGDPTGVPAQYVEKLINDVKNEYGDPYFQNVNYTGFVKANSSLESAYLELKEKKGEATKFDTVFTFELTMNLKPGSDEENAKSINLNPGSDAQEAQGQEVTE